MNVLLAGTLAISFAIGANGPTGTAGIIRIEVYNYAHVADATLAQAEDEAARVFRDIAVGTAWFRCPVTPVGSGHDLSANTRTSAVFVIRLLSNTMAARYPLRKTVCALALIPEGGVFGMYANVFADRILESTADPDLGALIIGNVIAHEIGHLIVGRQHSATGLMHSSWTVSDLRLIPRGGMRFSPDEANRIRARLLARTGTAELISPRYPEISEASLRTQPSRRNDGSYRSAKP